MTKKRLEDRLTLLQAELAKAGKKAVDNDATCVILKNRIDEVAGLLKPEEEKS
jgi:hypothetical protein